MPSDASRTAPPKNLRADTEELPEAAAEDTFEAVLA